MRSRLKTALWSFLRVWLFGLREALERGMSERNDGGVKAQKGPLGGCSDRTDSPSRKLIIENMDKSYYCGCKWGMWKISSLCQFECQRRNQSGLWERGRGKERERERDYWLSLTNWIFISVTQPLYTQKHIHAHTLLWKSLKEETLWKCCWQQSNLKKDTMKANNHTVFEDGFKAKEQICSIRTTCLMETSSGRNC